MYAYDHDEYAIDPGLYIEKDNFWGYYTEVEEDLLSYINNDQFVTHNRNEIKQKFFTYDDNESVKRVAAIARNILK